VETKDSKTKFLVVRIVTVDSSVTDAFGRPALTPTNRYQVIPPSAVLDIRWSEHDCTRGGCLRDMEFTSATLRHDRRIPFHLARSIPGFVI
jgi:hypothetical protein